MYVADTGGERTRNVARVVGPYLLVLAVVVVVRAPDMAPLLTEFAASALWPFVMGAFALLGGVAIVAFHQVWRGAAAVVVSLVGWLLVVRGLFLLLFPGVVADLAGRLIGATPVWLIGYAVMALLGLYLTYVGYRPARKAQQSKKVQQSNGATVDPGLSPAT